jgi:hypothetical protein
MNNDNDDDCKIESENLDQMGKLIDVYTKLDTEPLTGRVIESPPEDLKRSLSTFVQHYLQRIQGHKDIEDILKEALIEKLPEADFDQIQTLLNTIMRNSNNAVEKVMAPFIAQKEGGVGGDTNNTFMFGDTTQKAPVEDKMLKDDSLTPDMIKGLYDLAQMMNAITSTKPVK